MYHTAIVIPALNPPEGLISYIKELINNGFENILLIDDGSEKDKQYIFDSLDKFDQVTILRHARNLGKGRALKDAFNYILIHFEKRVQGVITADSDGQHSIEDIIQIRNILETQREPALILGTRNFGEKQVPFKSKFGNKITSLVLCIFYGIKIADTQTGLRAIPKEYLYDYCNLDGEGFEFETNMLIYGVEHKQKIVSHFIKTIYFNKNNKTHFRPFIDSLKIYKVILKKFIMYLLSSASALAIDIALFPFFLVILKSINIPLVIFWSTIIARIFSSIWNFIVNSKFIFHSTRHFGEQVVKYYILCICQMLLSAVLVAFIHYLLLGNELLEKLIVDGILFFFSYQIQRVWVFRSEI